MAFSAPHYFYEQGDPPDLVDVNGPIYARTGGNLGNLVPRSGHDMSCAVSRYSSGGLPEPASTFNMSIDSHGLHVVKRVYSPRPNNDESPIVAVGLSGYVEPTTTFEAITEAFSITMYSDGAFGTDGTVQLPISVVAMGSPNEVLYAGCAVLLGSAKSITEVDIFLRTVGVTPQPSPLRITKIWFYS